MTTEKFLLTVKDQIKRGILKSEIAAGYDENGIIYQKVTKEEMVERILSLYDHVVYEFEQINASANALEALIHKYNPDLNKEEFMRDYIQIVEKYRLQSNCRLEEESDNIEGNKNQKNRFKVIQGGKE